jgi:hypothetical protein
VLLIIRPTVLWDTIGTLYWFMLGYGLAELLTLEPKEEEGACPS